MGCPANREVGVPRCVPLELAVDFKDLAGLNGGEACEAGGYESQKLRQTARPRSENDNGNLSGRQILLVFDALIYGEEDVEFCSLRGYKKVAVLQSG